MRVMMQELVYSLSHQQGKSGFWCDIELSRRAQQRVHDARNGSRELGAGQLRGLNNSVKRPTRPVTGLSFARDEAYDTDWGISMLATVMPARKSPANLRDSKYPDR